ncbi:hypothetical protein GCM10009868_39940 [Terrabacter aerolatus]|uniref:Uncharacterized protein n=1 Tax=Terrabacter aerolatus TaxID=422442 RepID=A0A512D080_9MICO|nr:hypothetical protein [Terrabacter aerolatus]GEO29873.1 hypothetical protein TAE01_16830 [Terrabacter aerolatus]
MTPAEERSGDLLDVALADEIELVSDLVVAASSSPRHFTPQEVDQLLGVAGRADDGTDAPLVPAVGNVPDLPDAPSASD